MRMRCIMDTSDPKITLDANGVCNHCLTADQLLAEAEARDRHSSLEHLLV
jgi:hypothetical protein